MENRYVVKEDQLSKYDISYPSCRVYRIYDKQTQAMSKTYYLTKEACQKMVNRKNE